MTDRSSSDALRGVRIAAIALLSAAAFALPTSAVAQSTEEIVTQPARDVGIAKTNIPPLLMRTSEDPYTREGATNCAQIASSIAELTAEIGPDFSTSPVTNKQNIAKLGGAAVINSLIPFRGIIREVSGASAAERRLNLAIDAGIARRGFLRGLQVARKCRM